MMLYNVAGITSRNDLKNNTHSYWLFFVFFCDKSVVLIVFRTLSEDGV